MTGKGELTRRRGVIAAVASIAVLLLTGSVAGAQSSYCGQLQSQYVAASQSGSGGGNVSQLRREYARTESLARSNGCKRFLFFGPKPSRQCPQIMGQLNRLQRDINRASRSGFGNSRQNVSYQRSRLRDRLIDNGCSIPGGGSGGGSSAGYRTLCVRTCDGYYFPVSSSASRSRFKIDQSVCKAFYGNAEAELYINTGSAAIENARSLTGESYMDLENALAFRSSFSPSCQGELHAGLRAIAAAQEIRVTRLEAEQAANPGPVLPTPIARVNTSLDPETRANLAGNFRVEPVTPSDADPDLVADAGEAEIRRIGPAYYYAQPIKIEGLKPTPWQAPDFSFVGTANAEEKTVGKTARTDATTVQ